MSDSLFLMQRYWGSDDENDKESDNANLRNNVNISENKTSNKRQKLDSQVIELESDIEDIQGSNYQDSINNIPETNAGTIRISDQPVENLKKGKESLKVKNKISKNSLTESVSSNSYSDIEEIRFAETSDLGIKCSRKKRTSSKDKINLPKDIQKKSQKSISLNSLGNKVQTDFASENTEDTGYDSIERIVVSNKKPEGLKKSLEIESELSKPTSLALTENVESNFCTIGEVKQQQAAKVRQTLPHWLSNPTYIGVNLGEEKTPISELNYLDSNTKKSLKAAGIEFLFPVQLAVIPWLIQSKDRGLLVRPSDICVSAPTGSGKTLAFVLPIVQSLKERVAFAIRALVVLPVSELAIQVFKVFQSFTKETDLKVTLLTGQKSFLAEQNALVKCVGNKVQSVVDIVVTTPGRIYDHIYKTRGFCLKSLRYLVIDEADRMMDEIQQGWLKQIEDAVFQDCRFSSCVCSHNKRMSLAPSSAFNFGLISQPLQKLLYSATLTHDPEQLHSLSLYKPKLFTASNTNSKQEHTGLCTIPDKLNMLQVVCEEGIKPMVLCFLIKKFQFKRVLCFTESLERAHRLHLVLEEIGLFQVREISSLNQAVQRKIAIHQFASGKVDILVCSDLVARGIDIKDIDCVISYDVPLSVKIYIHRIGRTARAGKSGTAITLLSHGEIPHFKQILKSAEIEIPKKVDVNNEDLKPFISSYENALAATDTKIRHEKFILPGKSAQKNQRKRHFK